MPAKLLNCEVCGRPFWASRIDSKYCRMKCRTQSRMENAKFETPKIPRSGVPGVSFNRVRKRWMVSIKLEDGAWKYVGCFKTREAATVFQKSLAEPVDELAKAAGGGT